MLGLSDPTTAAAAPAAAVAERRLCLWPCHVKLLLAGREVALLHGLCGYQASEGAVQSQGGHTHLDSVCMQAWSDSIPAAATPAAAVAGRRLWLCHVSLLAGRKGALPRGLCGFQASQGAVE